MVSKIQARDPEIMALSQEIHGLTGQIKILVAEINKASVLLSARVDMASKERKE